MQREYLMLMQDEKSMGAVKLESGGEFVNAEITVDSSVDLGAHGVLKAYLSLPGKGENRYLGVLEEYKGIFTLADTVAPLGIVITFKNTLNGEENFCCLCAEEGKLLEVKECFFGIRENPEEKKEEKEYIPEQTEEKTDFEKEYMQRAEDNLKGMFKDFSFEKINGYYLRNNSRIISYIMGGNGVHRQIMNYGHYYFATKNSEGCTEFIIALPGKRGEKSPFENCEEYTFEVKDKGFGDEKYFCVKAGADKDGEYFCRKK